MMIPLPLTPFPRSDAFVKGIKQAVMIRKMINRIEFLVVKTKFT